MPSKDATDAELVAKLHARDADAIAVAYDRYGQLAYSLFVRVTRDQSAAEDLVQELFLRVWNKARDFDPNKGTLGVWILSIARNMAIDHVRSAQARFQTRMRPIEQTDQISFSYKPKEPESTIDSARAVRLAFSELNSNQRRVLEMAYFEGFSQSEIAAKLQEPLGTVKSWMRSAMGRVRTAVKAGVTG
ncbi:MAG: sigma-70 family RNA polymerase sigma factor [Acidobacteriota bacterium]|nr:sigma-70 family RNA polymerase sigma factor [Acidobacteriota bacterium]